MLHPPEYAEKVKVIHGWARKAGRDPKDITLSLRVPLELAPRRGTWTGADQPGFRGTVAEVIAHIKAYQVLGVSHFVFDLAAPDLRGQLSLMERFAQEVRPKVLRAPR
jgi:alkanesulfonate monooxygenase SsuD/methylene tetrahydromethanopterin reductase-like flavin-dependent oxidoreductase (luciferase family)